jgi:hypothetical protein
MAVAIAAAVQNTYPPRVAVGLTGLTVTDEVAVYRQVAGLRTLLRGGYVESVTDTALSLLDAELPFGTPVTYVAVVEGVEHATSATSYSLPGGKVVLSDAIIGLAAEVTIMAADTSARTRKGARFQVGSRNVVVSGPLPPAEGGYELFLGNTVARDNLMVLLEQATEGIVQIRQPGGYDGIDAYLAVDRTSEARWSQDGTDERRLITIGFAEVEAWPAGLTAMGFTYGEVAAYYTGLTYADAAADHSTYFDAMQADFS